MQDSEAREARKLEVARNYEAFKAMLPELLERHRGAYALMHDCGVVDTYSTFEDAVLAGSSMYEDGIFSVQEITDVPVDLGCYSRGDSVVWPGADACPLERPEHGGRSSTSVGVMATAARFLKFK